MPYCHQPYKDAIEKTWKFNLDWILAVDNTKINNGIMRANNLGIDKMYRDNSDWLILLSAALRFGEPGGLDFIQALEERPDHLVVEAYPVYGWHLIAFSRRTVDTLGRFDCNFTPYGYDDIDYSVRFHRAFATDGHFDGIGDHMWTKAKVDVEDMGMAHGLNLTDVVYTTQTCLEDYFCAKWGRHPDSSWDHLKEYTHPFNNPGNSIGFWPPAQVNDAMCYWDRSEEPVGG
jgi:hypothetical protein